MSAFLSVCVSVCVSVMRKRVGIMTGHEDMSTKSGLIDWLLVTEIIRGAIEKKYFFCRIFSRGGDFPVRYVFFALKVNVSNVLKCMNLQKYIFITFCKGIGVRVYKRIFPFKLYFFGTHFTISIVYLKIFLSNTFCILCNYEWRLHIGHIGEYNRKTNV